MDTPAPSLSVALRYALLLLSCAAALVYFQWRLGVMNPHFPAYAWSVFAAELAGFARVLMFLAGAVRLPHREPPAAVPPGLTVDVYIPTYDEPVHVVRRTVLAALAIRYLHETWLLDDGGRPEMAALASELGCRYVARDERRNAKAGNLNHALGLARGEFVAILDADHVADPHFLDRTLGYFSDARLGFVQTPQEFYNLDSFEHLSSGRARSNGASFFHRIVQHMRDRANATMYSGSAAVFRRAALDSVAGFATASVSEDVLTSVRLHAAGWSSVFHPEILSGGMAPLDAAAYFQQRLRWAQDAVQVFVRANPIALPGLTPGQRQSYLIHIVSNLEGWRHLFIYALPVAMLVTGVLPLQSGAATFLLRFGPYFAVTAVACAVMGRGHLRWWDSAVYNLARCPTALLAPFTARTREWRVTPKTHRPPVNSPSTDFASGLLLVNLAAIAYAWAAAVAGRSPFDAGALAVLSLWAAFNAATAARLLALARRCARNGRAATVSRRLYPTPRRDPAS